MQFSKGDYFLLDNEKVEIKDLLGAGGQGEVYLADYQGQEYAVKVYIDEQSSDFKFNLKNNIQKGSPSSSFLWPKKHFEFDDGKCGYLMDLRPKNYESFVSYINGKSNFKNQETLIKWCIELCTSFKKLHEMGYSYQDLNDGAFFLEPETGELLICDNDNVTAAQKNLGIIGMMRFMAPEVGRREYMPDVHSDRFSLAVILFLALCKGWPFDGERLKQYDLIDEESEYEMYCKNPIFVYHKEDKSNRPIRGYHTTILRRWAYIPLYIKEAFHRTFVDGLADRENERTTELEWLKLLTKYRDELITCPSCGYSYIAGYYEKKTQDICPSCSVNKKRVCRLKIGNNQIALDLGKKLFECHIDKYSSEYNKCVGKVIANKKNPGLWGIKIALDEDIEIKDSQGTVKVVNKDGVIPIIDGLKIKFPGNIIGEILEK